MSIYENLGVLRKPSLNKRKDYFISNNDNGLSAPGIDRIDGQIDRTGFGHSGHGGGHHSGGGYGHSGGGYGHGGHHGGHSIPCCPLVVDPFTVIGLIGFIAASTYFLNILITMNIMAPGKRRRKRANLENLPSMLQDMISKGTVINTDSN